MDVRTIVVKCSTRMSLVSLRDENDQPILVDGDDKILVYDKRCVEVIVSVISALTGKTFTGSGNPGDNQILRAN